MKNGRIHEQYILALGKYYNSPAGARMYNKDKNLMDLFVYFKYYLPNAEYQLFIESLVTLLIDLRNNVPLNAFDFIRKKMGVRDVSDLITLKDFNRSSINYNSLNTPEESPI